MAKSKKGLYIGIIAVVVVVAVVAVILILNKGNGGDVSQTEDSLTASDLANVDIEVEYGDFDAMKALSKEIQNGRATGKIVKIDGLVAHPGTKYSVVQKSEEGSLKIGTEFFISDAKIDEYPEDGDHIVITGKIVEEEPLLYEIQTLKEFVEVK